jgi:hypothetical protein
VPAVARPYGQSSGGVFAAYPSANRSARPSSSSSTWRLDGSTPCSRIDQRTAASRRSSSSILSRSRIPVSVGAPQRHAVTESLPRATDPALPSMMWSWATSGLQLRLACRGLLEGSV